MARTASHRAQDLTPGISRRIEMVTQAAFPNASPVDALADSLELPKSSYEAASARYADLGDWLHDASRSAGAHFKPAVSPQGSFRLGTAVRPWKRDHYDLDVTCVLLEGISKDGWTQKAVKDLVGTDLENYRRERGVSEPLEEKHRCWRLNYQDELSFHIDVVPAIPQTGQVQSQLQELMVTSGASEIDALNRAGTAIAITDDRHPRYQSVTDDWHTSNPEGFARWFESRMQQAETYLRMRAERLQVESVEALPSYRWKTPLQRSIQVLKRHRDVMFEQNTAAKPSSIVITTLAARAYAGEADLRSALVNILGAMEEHIATVATRVSNPVNPAEDFTDGWRSPEGQRLELERHFGLWLHQARIDFELYVTASSAGAAAAQAEAKFGTRVDMRVLESALGSSQRPEAAGAVHHIRRGDAPKPWRR